MSTAPAAPETVTLASLLNLRDFRLFLTGRFFGSVAVQIQSVAIGWQVYEITKSPMALGFVGLAQFLPMVILLLPAGDIADRVDRRVIAFLSYLVQGISVALLALFTWTGIAQHAIWPIYLALVIFGSARAFSGPATRAYVPLLVSKAQLPRGIAVSSSTFQVATIGGPALGGFIYVAGPLVAYAICFAFFLVSAFAFFAIRTRSVIAPADTTLSTFGRVTAGLRYIFKKPIVLGAVSLDLFAVLLGGAAAMMPIFAADILHVGPEGLGLLRSGPALGAVLVNFLLIAMPLQRHTGYIMFACVAIFGVATITFGLSENFVLSMGALLIMGGADMVSVYVRSTLIPLATPPEMLGRVSAVDMLFISASNELGEFESGVMAGLLGTVPSVVVGGMGTIGIVALWMYLFPDLRKVDRLMDVKPD